MLSKEEIAIFEKSIEGYQIHLVDYAVFQELSPAVFLRGYIIGDDPREMRLLTNKWWELRSEFLEDAAVFLNVRAEELVKLTSKVDLSNAEDIRSYLSDRDFQGIDLDLFPESCFAVIH